MLAVNKMDLVDFSEERFNEIVAEYKKFVSPLGIPDVNCIPLSALDGDNVVDKSERTPWYKGTSLLDFLETVHIAMTIIWRIFVSRCSMCCVRIWILEVFVVRWLRVLFVRGIR